MNKIRIKSTPLFKQVAAVIGEEKAQIELAIAYHEYSGYDEFEFHKDLIGSFVWSDSPQGHDFWESIDKWVDPCKN